MKKLLIFLSAVFIVFFLAACTATEDPEGEAEPKEQVDEEGETGEQEEEQETTEEEITLGENVLRLNNGTEPASLDPSIGFDEVSWDPLNNLMEGLTRLDEDSSAPAGVAEDWDVSEDGLICTCYLRADANWSNGDPVVAEDFIYAWSLMLDPEAIQPA